MTVASAQRPPTSWEALSNRVFRNLWIAGLVSIIGNWMQTVGAQWLLLGVPNSSVWVSLVQTAETVPALFVALPAGVLADAFDRRSILIGIQASQASVGAVLTGLTIVGGVTPPMVIACTVLLAIGASVQQPTWIALIPELVPRAHLSSAAALGSIQFNIARAIGPAIAGLVIAHLGVSWVFALNTATVLVYAGVLLAWRRPPPPASTDRERFLAAVRAGSRYVRHAPAVRRVLLRLALFLFPANVLWALLPVYATARLGVQSSGYGLLLASVGAGAVLGATLLPRSRRALTPQALLAAPAVAYGACLVVLLGTTSMVAAVPTLLIVGITWTTYLANVNSVLLGVLPSWVRARVLSITHLVMFSSLGFGAAMWGLIANQWNVSLAFAVAAVMLVVGGATATMWPLIDPRGSNDPSNLDGPPTLSLDAVTRHAGPVVVQVEYRVSPDRVEDFLNAMPAVQRSRRRTGATSWRLLVHGEHGHTFVEQFVMASGRDYARQRSVRITSAELALLHRAAALAQPAPETSHFLEIETPATPTTDRLQT